MKRSVIAGISAVIVAGAMCGSAHALPLGWPQPTTLCNASNTGATQTTVKRIYSSNGRLVYTDYATYLCEGASWLLVDVTRCFEPNGYCAPL
jgi:hypothetical protein